MTRYSQDKPRSGGREGGRQGGREGGSAGAHTYIYVNGRIIAQQPKIVAEGVAQTHLISPMLLPITFVVGLFLAFSNIWEHVGAARLRSAKNTYIHSHVGPN